MADPITVTCPMPECGWTSSIPIADDYPPSVIDMLTGSAGQVREHHITQHGALAWFEAWKKAAAEQATARPEKPVVGQPRAVAESWTEWGARFADGLTAARPSREAAALSVRSIQGRHGTAQLVQRTVTVTDWTEAEEA